MTEFSRVKQVKSNLPDGGWPFTYEADEAERLAVAQRLDLVTLEHFDVTGRLLRGPRNSIVIVQGEIQAQAVQSCVVTFEPVTASLQVPFERYFTSEPLPESDEIIIGIDDEEPEPYDGEMLDLGEIATEELALALDPYPRSPGADQVLSHLLPDADEPEEPNLPFARLQSLKRRDGQ